MRILDQNGNELQESTIDHEKGYLKQEQLFLRHHEAVESVEEQGHWKTVAEYPNGGKDVEWIIDVAAVEAKEAWDEYEDIFRYIPYTAEELAEREARKREEYEKSSEYRITELEAALELLLSGVTE